MDYSKEFIELKEEIDELRQALIEVLEAPLHTSFVRKHSHRCDPTKMKKLSEIKERLQASGDTKK